MKFTPEVVAALAVLRAAAENDFERHRIDVLERDLTSPPAAEVIDENHQRFNNIVYKKTASGHFNRTLGIQQTIWAYVNGEIPKGYEIHHIDGNSANNTIENLQCMTKSEHTALHVTTGNIREYRCVQCGKKFTSNNRAKNSRFCSRTCATTWRRANVQVEKACENCGKVFSTPKDRPSRFCSPHCSRAHAVLMQAKKSTFHCQ